MRKLLIISLLISTFLSSAYAVQARKGWQTITQPDGTTIEVQLVGDEWFHYYMNRDGRKVRQNDAGYWVVISDDEFDKGRNAKRTTISVASRHTMHVGDSYTPEVHTNSNGSVAFYTEDPEIVSIDPILGTIMALKVGCTQVVVEVGSTRTHCHATRTIRIKVEE